MPKCDFNKIAKQLYWNYTSAWVFSCKCAAYFHKNTFGRRLLHSSQFLAVEPLSENSGNFRRNRNRLTHLSPLWHFYTSWKRQKTYGILTFSGGIEMWHWTKMGKWSSIFVNFKGNWETISNARVYDNVHRYSGPSPTSKQRFLWKQYLKAVYLKVPYWMFDWVLNTLLCQD